jgi:hypothetical protein
MLLLPLRTKARIKAFTVVEGVIAMTLLLMGVIAIYSGITFGFNTVRMARENTRATQIMIEKTEQVRLFNWDQLTSTTNSYLPTNDFYVSYYSTNLGVTYTGRVSVTTPATIPSGYATNMREITVTVNWTTGSLPRTRSLTTYVSKYGLQNYIY